MKKALKVIALVLVAATVLCMFAGCVKSLKGTYKAESGASLTFDKNQKVTGELFGITIDGTYEINGDMIKFNYSGIAGIGATLEKPIEINGKTIIIDGTEFTKE